MIGIHHAPFEKFSAVLYLPGAGFSYVNGIQCMLHSCQFVVLQLDDVVRDPAVSRFGQLCSPSTEKKVGPEIRTDTPCHGSGLP